MTDLREKLEISLPGGVPLELRRISATGPEGFRMGSRGIDRNKEPVTRVVIPAPFYLGTYPVTQEQYRELAKMAGLDPEPSHFKNLPDSDQRRVEQVSWDDAVQAADAMGE